MPSFSTPDPTELRVRLGAGDLTVQTGSDGQTEVDVRPANPADSADVEHAEGTAVTHHGDTISVLAPQTHGRRSPSISVHVRLPEGSRLEATVASADLRTRGRLGDVEVSSASGDVRLDHVGAATVRSSSGDVELVRADGPAEVTTASGDVRARVLDRDATVTTASGDCLVEVAHGALRLQTASGDALVRDARASVEGKTASGDLTLRRVHTGRVHASTASGDIAVAVATGTAALLDVSSLSGDVVSQLEPTDEPADGDKTVEIHGRTLSGDIIISRT